MMDDGVALQQRNNLQPAADGEAQIRPWEIGSKPNPPPPPS